jgi:hypothetical protein
MERRGPWVTLYCLHGHDHVLAPAQAERLLGTPCCWCGTPIVCEEDYWRRRIAAADLAADLQRYFASKERRIA